MDAVARYCAASEAGDMPALAAALADDVRLASPVSGRMVFAGKRDVHRLLTAVHAVLRGLRWTPVPGDGDRRVALGEARVGGLVLTDAMVFELGADGRITMIRPHLRPWLALTVFATLLLPRVGRHPGMVRRALAGAR
jgi:SnoaL-like protein